MIDSKEMILLEAGGSQRSQGLKVVLDCYNK